MQREEAYEEGKKVGIETGQKLGRVEGEIIGTIRTCKEFHISAEEILKKLMENFSLTKKKAEEYMKKYDFES